MLADLSYSINTILPALILAFFGIFLKRVSFVNDDFISCVDKIVFKIALPALLFIEVSGCSIENMNPCLIIFCSAGVTASFLLVSVISALTIKDRSKIGAFTQGFCRSNFAVLGIPLAESMFGEAGVELISILMPFVIIMFNAYSVILLSAFSSDRETVRGKKMFLRLAKDVFTNPLIIAVVLALPFMLTSASIPAFAQKSLSYVGNLATPLALISLGASFSKNSLREKAKYAVISSIGKTMLLPAVFVTAAALIGFKNERLGLVLILFGSPSAVSSYIMAKRMGNDAELSSQILLITTILCIPTLFIGIFILKTLNLI